MLATVVRNSTAEWQAIDRRHHLHPFTDPKVFDREGVRVITRAKGVHLWDSEGRRLIDGMAGLWCVNLGYGRKELAEAAQRQMLEMPYYNTSSRPRRRPRPNSPSGWSS